MEVDEQKIKAPTEEINRLPQRRYFEEIWSLARLPMNLLNPKEAAKAEVIKPKSDLEISKLLSSNMEGTAIVRAFLSDARQK
jgi:hypothetical protein